MNREETISFRSIIEGKIAALLAAQIMVVEAVSSSEESKKRYVEIMNNINIDPADQNPEDPLPIDNVSFQYGVLQIRKSLADNLLKQETS